VGGETMSGVAEQDEEADNDRLKLAEAAADPGVVSEAEVQRIDAAEKAEEAAATTAAAAGHGEGAVGPGRYCLPCHPHAFYTSFLNLDGTL
jgi:hypothetical protein